MVDAPKNLKQKRWKKNNKKRKKKEKKNTKQNLNYELNAFGGVGKLREYCNKTSYRVQSINCFMLDIQCVYLN